MSLDWGATARLLALGALGIAVVGIVIQTAAGASIRKRERAASVGGALILGGFLAAGALITAVHDDRIAAVGGLVAIALLLPSLIVDNPRTRLLIPLSSAVSVGIQARTAWLKGEIAEFLWTAGAVTSALLAIAVAAWLHSKLIKPKPRRDAHA